MNESLAVYVRRKTDKALWKSQDQSWSPIGIDLRALPVWEMFAFSSSLLGSLFTKCHYRSSNITSVHWNQKSLDHLYTHPSYKSLLIYRLCRKHLLLSTLRCLLKSNYHPEWVQFLFFSLFNSTGHPWILIFEHDGNIEKLTLSNGNLIEDYNMMMTIFTSLSTPDNNPSQSDKNGGQFRNEMIKSQLAEMLVTIFVSFYNHLMTIDALPSMPTSKPMKLQLCHCWQLPKMEASLCNDLYFSVAASVVNCLGIEVSSSATIQPFNDQWSCWKFEYTRITIWDLHCPALRHS